MWEIKEFLSALISFDYCSNHIKTLAKVYRWLCLIASIILIITGVVMAFAEAIYWGEWDEDATEKLLPSAIGVGIGVVGWISSLFIYGFGIIVDAHENALLKSHIGK